MLPFWPEEDDALRSRFPAAISDPYSVADALHGGAEVLAHQRRHVLDFRNGLRLIASKDMHPDAATIAAPASDCFHPQHQIPRSSAFGCMLNAPAIFSTS